ncbi:Na+/H+ antiporter NhaA [Peredibacter sp. HCB2-198]|uniref:Na+/H+ antiporter NhaA n=1 Tax=Peredibacter sp. HCB2-198 TaxID=3383025 RepID=UPI0038B51066
MESNHQGLPHEIIHHITGPLSRFLKIEALTGAMLLIGTVAALILMNSPWSGVFQSFWEMPIGLTLGNLDFSRSLHHWIRDGLMTLFFFLVALELKRELVLGELRNFRVAALPLAGAIGGMLVPALLYLAISHGRPEAQGWGVVMATDTAFVIGCLALLGSRVPTSLRLFLLSLAIFDDVGAILIVAFGYGSGLNWMALGLGVLGLAAVGGAARIGVRSVPVYSLIGVIIWLCFDASGIHTTVAGVILGLMTPVRGWVSDERLRATFARILSYPEGDHWSGDTQDRKELYEAATAAKETLSPVERIELRLHPWVGFLIMPLFAFANAGIVIAPDALKDPATIAVAIGLTIGKPLGVFSMSWLSVRSGIACSFPSLSWPLLAAGSLLTGIGFTMSLFIAELAFPASLLAPVKMGIMTASLVSMATGITTLIYLTKKNRVKKSNAY